MNTKKKKQNNQQNLKEIITKSSNQGGVDPLIELTPEVLDKLPLSARQQIQQIIVSRSHRGPIPASDELQHYDKVCPGAANRIILMAEKEQDFRIKTTGERDKSDHILASRGQIFALSALILILLFCIFLACIGSTSGAVTVACTLVASIVIVFITGKRSSDKNDNNKDSSNQKKTK